MAESTDNNQKEAAGEPKTPAAKAKPGMVSNSIIPDGWTQVKPFPKKFLYRGNVYVFDELKKADIERITSFKRNPFFEKKASV